MTNSLVFDDGPTSPLSLIAPSDQKPLEVTGRKGRNRIVFEGIDKRERPRKRRVSKAKEKKEIQRILREEQIKKGKGSLKEYNSDSGSLLGFERSKAGAEGFRKAMNNGRGETRFSSEGDEEGGRGNSTQKDMTLRQWIGRPGRVVDKVESLHIFRQILDFVELAHGQGVILRNIRPSYFILSPLNRVAFIDSAGTRSSSDHSSERSTGRHRRHQNAQPVLRERRAGDGMNGLREDGSPESVSLDPSRRAVVLGFAGAGGVGGGGVVTGGADQSGRSLWSSGHFGGTGGVQQRRASGSRDSREVQHNRSSSTLDSRGVAQQVQQQQLRHWRQHGGSSGGVEQSGGSSERRTSRRRGSTTGGGGVSERHGARSAGHDVITKSFEGGRGSSSSAKYGHGQVGSGSNSRSDLCATVGDGRANSDSVVGGGASPESRFTGHELMNQAVLRSSSQECASSGAASESREEGFDERFPQKQENLREQIWYASPEEAAGGTGCYASDIYCLGVLFFELFCKFPRDAERLRAMSDLRNRILPPRLLSECPKEAAFCLWLLHPDPNSRPKARCVLESELLCEAGEALAERQAAVNMEEQAAECELLLDFLLRVQQQKEEAVSKLKQDVARLSSDIGEVEERRAKLQRKGGLAKEPDMEDRFRVVSDAARSRAPAPVLSSGRWQTGVGQNEDRKASFLGKRRRDDAIEFTAEEDGWVRVGANRRNDGTSSKTARLMKNFSAFEKVYFSMRWKVGPPGGAEPARPSPNASQAGAFSFVGGSGSNLAVPQDRGQGKGNAADKDWLGCFFDSICKYARFSRFEVKATLRHADLLNTANMVCSLSFDRDEEYFATAGVCKKIKIFECDSVLNEDVDIHYPVVEMQSRSKLSSVVWNSYIKSHVASSDYEGVVQLWDANTSKSLMQYEEHVMRAWSVDFSRSDPTKLASGSDDCCVKLWSINQENSIGTIKTRANICCVQFPPDSSHLLAFGSADFKVYCYDLRKTVMPLCVLASHNKAVSYVKFLDSTTLVSASTDNTLKLWDLNEASRNENTTECSVTYTGHLNEKNFVGLSAADGYIACGSENNSIFAYHKSLPMPMAQHNFGCVDPITGQETEDDNGQFVSSVCWRGKSQTLVAANSMGNIKVLEMV